MRTSSTLRGPPGSVRLRGGLGRLLNGERRYEKAREERQAGRERGIALYTLVQRTGDCLSGNWRLICPLYASYKSILSPNLSINAQCPVINQYSLPSSRYITHLGQGRRKCSLQLPAQCICNTRDIARGSSATCRFRTTTPRAWCCRAGWYDSAGCVGRR